jgi:hypothetical protein
LSAVCIVPLVFCITGVTTPIKLGDNSKLLTLRSAVFILKQKQIANTKYIGYGPKGFAES